jgi:(p)ppGpp synthase/HD superfamily hydrolase
MNTSDQDIRRFLYGHTPLERAEYYMDRARLMAHTAHDAIGQKRKYSGDPYWKHTDEVSDLVRSVAGITDALYWPREMKAIPPNVVMVMAANLHDVFEDVTNHESLPSQLRFDAQWMVNMIGEEGNAVVNMVIELTDVYTKEAWPDLNRARRKELEAKRYGKMSIFAKTIKLADFISNTRDIAIRASVDFAEVYLAEKEAALPFLFPGCKTLHDRAIYNIGLARKEIALRKAEGLLDEQTNS